MLYNFHCKVPVPRGDSKKYCQPVYIINTENQRQKKKLEAVYRQGHNDG